MTSAATQYRLLTRSDLDGLACAILLNELGILGSIKFVHPKDVQDGKVEVTSNDILTNLPYVPGCHLCFDHHHSEELRIQASSRQSHVLVPEADSTARVLYNYYGGSASFPDIGADLMLAVDKADSAKFTKDEILNPAGWVLLSFLMDPRTGLGRFRDFRVSNYQLMMELIAYCKEHTVEETLNLPDVRERVELYRLHRSWFVDQIRRCTTVHENVAVLDLRDEEVIYVGNRFMLYALYPECDVSIHVIWGPNKEVTVLAIGKSIFTQTCPTNIGDLALRYGGGGHGGAGTCQISNDRSKQVLEELISRLNAERTAGKQLASV